MGASFESIHLYYKSLNIESQVNDVRSNGKELLFAATDKLAITPGFIYIPVEGSVAILHAENELTIGNAIDYMPIGLMERYCPMLNFQYKCMTSVKVVEISYEKFDEIFFQNAESMQALSKILIFMTIFSLDLHAERKQLTSYQTIKPMLYRYLYRSLAFPNETEGLASFIISRTKLSRTHVFRVLADLKEGGYITMKSGKLISIDKDLPDGY
ncbi:helix-turn-helix domain-containing protein [Buttiauxella sp. A2-C1_F]|uniref:helix-turn-helix domain-containing protein n=1 Tax=Buttiauxella sp. A2-C1_F TaxID=2904526 RepID=UPI001E28EB8A|nr:helix-turn-helix domain-containing protein [Buttiauxella sp. A2-C1_F]MCE0844940.1 helix-turn-helix domain-containing protein [Buttiauxella sp. A2-C1_F]